MQYAEDPDSCTLVERIHTVVLFGAPHRGLEVEALEELTRRKPSHGLIADLEKDSTLLRSMSEVFPSVSAKLKIITCFELKQTPTAQAKPDDPEAWDRTGPPKFMVDRNSACLFMDRDIRIGISKNHSMIAKLSEIDSSYQELKDTFSDQVSDSLILMKMRTKYTSAAKAMRLIYHIGNRLIQFTDNLGHHIGTELRARLGRSISLLQAYEGFLNDNTTTSLLTCGLPKRPLIAAILDII